MSARVKFNRVLIKTLVRVWMSWMTSKSLDEFKKRIWSRETDREAFLRKIHLFHEI